MSEKNKTERTVGRAYTNMCVRTPKLTSHALYQQIRAVYLRRLTVHAFQLRFWLMIPALLLVFLINLVMGTTCGLTLSLGVLFVAFASLTFYDFYIFRTYSPDRLRIYPRIVLIIGFQCVIIYLTGGIESPFLPIMLPVGIWAGFYTRMPKAILTIVLYGFLLTVVVFLECFQLIPHYAPSWFAPGFYNKPLYVSCLLLAYVAVSTVATFLAAGVAQSFQETVCDLHQTREDLVAAYLERMRTLETISGKLAHELKNPLGSIKGLTQLLLKHEHDEKRHRHLSVIATEIGRMQSILEAFLNFSRPLEKLTLSHFAIIREVEDVLNIFEIKFNEHQLSVQRDYRTNVTILADRQKLKQVLINLLQNSIDASSKHGQIQVGIYEQEGKVIITIADTGHGIAPEVQRCLFTPYFTTRPSGTGLGLIIARAIVQAHGGQLSLKNRKEQGTCALIVLPLECIPPKQIET